MATYPIRMLKDENGQPFVPICGTNSMVYDDQTTLQEKLDQKIGSDNLIAGNAITITQQGVNLVVSADLPDMTQIENNISSLNTDVTSLEGTVGNIQSQVNTIDEALDNKLEATQIKAGTNITVTNTNNEVTIAAQVPTPAINYYGTTEPSNSLGNNGDLYILIES